jgi:hypothetical protein
MSFCQEISSKYDLINFDKQNEINYLTIISYTNKGNIIQLTFYKIVKVTIKGLYCKIKYLVEKDNSYTDELALKIGRIDRKKIYEFFLQIMRA